MMEPDLAPTRNSDRKWLLEVARVAELTSGEALTLPPSLPLSHAWSRVADASGVTEEDLAVHVAAAYGLRVAELKNADVAAQKLVPASLARRYKVFPLRQDDNRLVLATSDPTDLDMEQDLAFASGRSPILEVCSPSALEAEIAAHYSTDRILGDLMASMEPQADKDVLVLSEDGPETVTSDEIEGGPVVRLANLILRDAVRKNASDIHIEPMATAARVRFRVDGSLRHYMQVPLPVLARLISRIKVLGEIDISKRLQPQDGRARVSVDGREYDLRISTVPTRGNEKAVIRILDPYGAPRMEELGLPEAELQRFRELLGHRDGIVLVTGPTGSGKTTTLYSAMQEVATADVNVMTVEDPVEYEFPALTQIQVEPRQDVTFASALRAILRQDPDVILVGEIRDNETAEMAVQAALTGHLVLATLHTNDAIGAVRRLVDLGLDRPSIVSTLRGSLAQRLLRKTCAKCHGRKKNEAGTDFWDQCGGTGYSGRFAVMEVFTMSDRFEQLILDEVSPSRLLMEAEADGMRTMRQVAEDHVESGITDLAEVNRVLGGIKEDGAQIRDVQPSEQGHVLVVDDDAVNRAVARALLEKNGFRVSETCDGDGAIALLDARNDYSLMVLDLDMPRVGGREVLASVRNSVATAGLPVVVLTGTKDCDAEIELMRAGADDYIRKPIDPPRFMARIAAALRRAKG